MTKTQLLGPLQRDWVSKLRSGDYAQTKVYLHDKDGYCCLGLALEKVLNVEPATISSDGVCYYEKNPDGNVCWADYTTSNTLPGYAVMALGLRSPEGTFNPELLSDAGRSIWQQDESLESLAALNDAGASFTEIADFIEANPKAVFKEPC